MIASVELRNFKSHENTALAFRPGTNVIVGTMGSGKSSVMDAVCFALFGTFPALKSRRVALSDVVRGFGERKENDASVAVKLSHSGAEYSVLRKFSGKASEAFLRKNGELLEGPQPNRVTEAVGAILELDYDLFTRTAYCEQNRIDYFLMLGKGERKKQIDGLLGIERLEKARQTLSSVQNRLAFEERAQKSLLDASPKAGALEDASAKARGEIDALLAEISMAKTGAGAAEKELAKTKSLYEKARLDVDGLDRLGLRKESVQATLRALRRELDGRKKRLEELDLAAAGAGTREDVEKKRAESESELALREKELVERAKEHSLASEALEQKKTCAREIEALQKKMERLLYLLNEASIASAAASKEKLEKEESGLRNRESELSALIAQAKKAKDALETAIASCPVCGKPLEKHSRSELMQEREAELKHCLEEIGKARAKAGDLASKIHGLAASLQDLILSEAAMRDKKAGFERYSARAAGEQENRNALKHAVEAMAQAKKRHDAIIRASQALMAREAEGMAIGRATLGLEAAQKELADCEKRMRELREASAVLADRNALTKLERELDAVRERYYSAKTGAGVLEERLGGKKAEWESTNGKLQDVRVIEGKIRGVEGRIGRAKIYYNALVEVQETLRNRLVFAVNEAMASAWQKLYPYGDYSAPRLAPTADDYELELRTGQGSWIGIENASGGEKSIAALALRIAFARVLAPSLDWLALDEPTHNLDDAGIRALSFALSRGAMGDASFSQVFVITHDEALREAAEGALYVFEKPASGGETPTVTDATETG